MGVKMTGDWARAGRLLSTAGNPMVWQRAKSKAVAKECHRLRGMMVQAFNKGGPPGKRWKRLSVFTQLVSRAKKKGDRRPLMDTGDLRNSHSVVQVDGNTWFVGVHRTTRGKKNKQQLVNIAIIHEHGTDPFTVRVTEKMRRYFHWLHKATKGQIKPLKQSTKALVIRIPARPWIGPIWDKEQDNSAENIMRDTIKNLGVPGLSSAL
jgi:hypothetical protein